MFVKQDIWVTVDAVVFGYNATDGISILLIKRKNAPYKGKWAIPGGFVDNNESLEVAVARELEEETGIKVDYLEQLYTFGKPGRDPRHHIVSVAYFGLVRPEKFEPQAASDAEDARWFNIHSLPETAFDHKEIIDMAVIRLRNKISYEPVGFELLDEKFAFSELHTLYETLHGKQIDRRNFKKKFLGLNILEELTEKNIGGKGRPGNLFRFNRKRYFELKKKGFVFEV